MSRYKVPQSRFKKSGQKPSTSVGAPKNGGPKNGVGKKNPREKSPEHRGASGKNSSGQNPSHRRATGDKIWQVFCEFPKDLPGALAQQKLSLDKDWLLRPLRIGEPPRLQPPLVMPQVWLQQQHWLPLLPDPLTLADLWQETGTAIAARPLLHLAAQRGSWLYIQNWLKQTGQTLTVDDYLREHNDQCLIKILAERRELALVVSATFPDNAADLERLWQAVPPKHRGQVNVASILAAHNQKAMRARLTKQKPAAPQL